MRDWISSRIVYSEEFPGYSYVKSTMKDDGSGSRRSCGEKIRDLFATLPKGIEIQYLEEETADLNGVGTKNHDGFTNKRTDIGFHLRQDQTEVLREFFENEDTNGGCDGLGYDMLQTYETCLDGGDDRFWFHSVRMALDVAKKLHAFAHKKMRGAE